MPAAASGAQTLGDSLAGMISEAGPVLFYLAVWGLVFCGTALFIGVVVPFLTGDSLLFAAGIVAATNDDVSIWVLCAGVAVAAIAGDQVGFVLGRRYGRPYLLRRRSRFVRAAVERTERLYELFGWWSVVVGRYVPWVRVFVAPVAGIGGMAYWRFVTANVVGAVTWGVLITAVGYWAATVPATRPIAYAVAGVVVVASVIAGVRAWRADRRARAAESDSAVTAGE